MDDMILDEGPIGLDIVFRRFEEAITAFVILRSHDDTLAMLHGITGDVTSAKTAVAALRAELLRQAALCRAGRPVIELARLYESLASRRFLNKRARCDPYKRKEHWEAVRLLYCQIAEYQDKIVARFATISAP